MVQVQDAGVELDATFELQHAEEQGQLDLILKSRSGSAGGPNARNTDYFSALELLLYRLSLKNAVLQWVAVDSAPLQSVEIEDRLIALDTPIELREEDFAELRLRITSGQRTVGQQSGATGGNNHKRIRLRVRLSEESIDLERLAIELSQGDGATGYDLATGQLLTRLGGVYVGSNGAVNLKVGLDAETWGWSLPYDEQQELEVGDLFLLAYGGGGRVKIDAWVEKTAKEIHLCRVTKARYEEPEPLWPDESDERSYPHRIGIEVLASVSDFDYGLLPLEVNELFQTSSTKQGRVFVSEFDSADELLAAFGVGAMPGTAIKAEGTISDVVAEFAAGLVASNIDYGLRHEQLVRRFVTSLVTKRFLILTGLSGSGKTKIAQAFGEWLGEGRSKIVAVRPDWTSPDHLLGYRNDLAEPTPSGQPWEVPETLEITRQAIQNPDIPYLLILDEMNLAHVERYFADVLSGIESDAPVIPNINADGAQDEDKELVPLPSNLFVVGTVNVDETTYMFSPKVLDRANTIEFRVETDDLGKTDKPPSKLAAGEAGHVARFLKDSRKEVTYANNSDFAGWIRDIHTLLSVSGREFGHRSYAEMMEFAHHYELAGGDGKEAFDVQVYQKVLPRIHGSQRDVGPTIEALAEFCFAAPGSSVDDNFKVATAASTDAHLPLSFDKVQRMWRRLQDTHFVSFAE